MDIINEYHLQAKFKADMHSISVCAWRDLEGTWVLSHFQINKEDVEAIMTYWKERWKHDVPQNEISESEDEEIPSEKKKTGKRVVAQVVKGKKTTTKKNKKVSTKKKKVLETIKDTDEVAGIRAATQPKWKHILTLGGMGSTPKKSRGLQPLCCGSLQHKRNSHYWPTSLRTTLRRSGKTLRVHKEK